MLIREIRGKGFAFAFVEVSRKKPSSLRARFKEAKEEGTVSGQEKQGAGPHSGYQAKVDHFKLEDHRSQK